MNIRYLLLTAVVVMALSNCSSRSNEQDSASTENLLWDYHLAYTQGLNTDDVVAADAAVLELDRLHENGAPIALCSLRYNQAQIVAGVDNFGRAFDLMKSCTGSIFDFYRATLHLKKGARDRAVPLLEELSEREAENISEKEMSFHVMVLVLLDEDPSGYIDEKEPALDDSAAKRLREIGMLDAQQIIRSVWP